MTEQPSRIDVVAAEVENGDYLVDCSACGAVGIAEGDEVDDVCRDHLRSHGISVFFNSEGETT